MFKVAADRLLNWKPHRCVILLTYPQVYWLSPVSPQSMKPKLKSPSQFQRIQLMMRPFCPIYWLNWVSWSQHRLTWRASKPGRVNCKGLLCWFQILNVPLWCFKVQKLKSAYKPELTWLTLSKLWGFEAVSCFELSLWVFCGEVLQVQRLACRRLTDQRLGWVTSSLSYASPSNGCFQTRVFCGFEFNWPWVDCLVSFSKRLQRSVRLNQATTPLSSEVVFATKLWILLSCGQKMDRNWQIVKRQFRKFGTVPSEFVSNSPFWLWSHNKDFIPNFGLQKLFQGGKSCFHEEPEFEE